MSKSSPGSTAVRSSSDAAAHGRRAAARPRRPHRRAVGAALRHAPALRRDLRLRRGLLARPALARTPASRAASASPSTAPRSPCSATAAGPAWARQPRRATPRSGRRHRPARSPRGAAPRARSSSAATRWMSSAVTPRALEHLGSRGPCPRHEATEAEADDRARILEPEHELAAQVAVAFASSPPHRLARAACAARRGSCARPRPRGRGRRRPA